MRICTLSRDALQRYLQTDRSSCLKKRHRISHHLLRQLNLSHPTAIPSVNERLMEASPPQTAMIGLLMQANPTTTEMRDHRMQTNRTTTATSEADHHIRHREKPPLTRETFHSSVRCQYQSNGSESRIRHVRGWGSATRRKAASLLVQAAA